MAFHVACPITCRKICFCALGFPRRLQSEKGKNEFLEEVARVEQFLNDPWLIKARGDATIQVKVPKVVVATAVLPPLPQIPATPTVGIGGDEAAAAASAQVKRLALQNQAAAASVVAEDYARRFESGDLVTSVEDTAGEEPGQPNTKTMCRLCFRGGNEGSERARKMLSCNSCGKKYHRSCLKSWSQHRDLFHWSSWTCPSCRTCEVCRRTGDPNKFMFCKRCDAGYHCYCQQPPHKNVGHGPYLCPKHTKCHSCGSSVPGNGLSVRWFLGYTCCDACGRLFVKNNYCPVCLKVYRDSESTPMVCCDICEKWVHCPCDGISEAKYMQFQVDGKLQYVCPTCRGECRQIRTLEEAVQELWRRRDDADKDLIVSLRETAGLPTLEDIFDISPFPDDEEGGPVVENEYGRSLKFSLKGVGDNSPRKSKEYGKKSSSKKSGKKTGKGTSLVTHQGDGSTIGCTTGDYKNEEIQISGEPDTLSPIGGSLTEGVCSVNEVGVSKHKYVEEITATNGNMPSRTIKIKSNKPPGLAREESIGTQSSLPKTAQGPKLVIHLGGRNKNTAAPPKSEALSFRKGQDLASSNGKRGIEDIDFTRSGSGVPVGKRSKYSSIKHSEDDPTISGDLTDNKSNTISVSQASEKNHKPYLKFKFHKNSDNGSQSAPSNSKVENQNLLPLPGKDEITYTRGQRSKRRRTTQGDEETSQWGEDNTIKDFRDANWILQKLGKDAAGKRVEVHHPSDNSWHRGTVIEVFVGTSMVSIALDDGKAKTFELGKQGIRFVSQKQKH